MFVPPEVTLLGVGFIVLTWSLAWICLSWLLADYQARLEQDVPPAILHVQPERQERPAGADSTSRAA